LALLAAAPAGADEDPCERALNQQRGDCSRSHVAEHGNCDGRCGACDADAGVTACFNECNSHCDRPNTQGGCGFDAQGCHHHCDSMCRDCGNNSGCRGWCCNGNNIQGCHNACSGTSNALSGCRGAWCGDGQAVKSCREACSGRANAAAGCRGAWCGGGEARRNCHNDIDQKIHECNRRAEAGFKDCAAKHPPAAQSAVGKVTQLLVGSPSGDSKSTSPPATGDHASRSPAAKSEAAEGVIGATCSAEPQCTNCDGKSGNVCHTISERFYPGVTQLVARADVIKECQEANALDECGNHCSNAERAAVIKKWNNCSSQCEKIAHCLYFDNQP
jgi:hypothetical protein